MKNEIVKYNLSPKMMERVGDLIEKNDFSEREAKFVDIRVRNTFWDKIDVYEYSTVKGNPTPTFSQIIKYYGKEEAIKIANYIIRSKLKKFSEDDIMMICFHLLSEEGLPGATILDLKLMMNMGLQGRFGKAYGEFKLSDVTGLNGWIDQYYEWRKKVAQIEREKAHLTKTDKFLPSPEDIPAPEWFKEATSKRMEQIGRGNLKTQLSKSKNQKYYSSIEEYCIDKGLDLAEFVRSKIPNFEEMDSKEAAIELTKLTIGINTLDDEPK